MSNISRFIAQLEVRGLGQTELIGLLQLKGIPMTRETFIKIEREVQHIQDLQLKAIMCTKTTYDELLKYLLFYTERSLYKEREILLDVFSEVYTMLYIQCYNGNYRNVMNMEVFVIIKIIRTELQMSLTEFAESIHVSFSMVNRWKNKIVLHNRMARALIIDLCMKRGIKRVF